MPRKTEHHASSTNTVLCPLAKGVRQAPPLSSSPGVTSRHCPRGGWGFSSALPSMPAAERSSAWRPRSVAPLRRSRRPDRSSAQMQETSTSSRRSVAGQERRGGGPDEHVEASTCTGQIVERQFSTGHRAVPDDGEASHSGPRSINRRMASTRSRSVWRAKSAPVASTRWPRGRVSSPRSSAGWR
ncbi:MAG: hypothetical protein CM15mP18_2780 [Methanobacteriota archaeon]|nr:MAG: hypothetical protein CM15mP18_2780 [Euryarchaeota archaeon]